MHLSTQTHTKTRKKNVASNENCILRNTGLNIQITSLNIFCKIAAWNKQTSVNKVLIIWRGLPCKKVTFLSEQSLKMTNFIWKKIFNRMKPSQPVFTAPASSARVLAHFRKMSMQVGKSVKGDRMLFLACTYLRISQKTNKPGSNKHVKK